MARVAVPLADHLPIDLRELAVVLAFLIGPVREVVDDPLEVQDPQVRSLDGVRAQRFGEGRRIRSGRIAEPIQGIVARIVEDPTGESTYVDIALRFEQSLPAPLQQGLKGRVDVELDEVSPATLILKSAGMIGQASDQTPNVVNN